MKASARQFGGGAPLGDGDRYRKLFDAMSEGFLLCEAIRDDSGKLVDYWLREANPAFLRRTKAGQGVLDQRLSQVAPQVSPEWLQACDQVMRTGEPSRFERWDPLAQRWYDVHVTRISESELAQIFVDVTDRKRAETFQSELFAELNHRVKNNLAIISALLSMQARDTSQPEAREQLRKAVDRIQAIADVHTGLSPRASEEDVDFAAYLTALCERISGALLDDGRVTLEVDVQPVKVGLDQAVPLGLIVNELVTNAVKHAYPPPMKGVVEVSVRAAADGLRLTVADNGRGMPATKAGKGRLGMRLVSSMVRHLGGELRLTSEGGACFEVRLPNGDAARPGSGSSIQ